METKLRPYYDLHDVIEEYSKKVIGLKKLEIKLACAFSWIFSSEEIAVYFWDVPVERYSCYLPQLFTDDKSIKLCPIAIIPKTNIFLYELTPSQIHYWTWLGVCYKIWKRGLKYKPA